jgi:hypothetical protein
MHTTLPRPPSVPLAIPAGSPLRTGWRATLVALLQEHGLVDVLDTVSAFAELAVRREPDTAEDPLDKRSVPLHQLLPGWFQRHGKHRGRISMKEDHRSPFGAVTPRRVADPALRRIEAIEIPEEKRGRPKLEE